MTERVILEITLIHIAYSKISGNNLKYKMKVQIIIFPIQHGATDLLSFKNRSNSSSEAGTGPGMPEHL